MLDNQDSIDNELKIKIPKRSKFIAIGWLLTCGVIFSFWLNCSPDNTVRSLSLGDIGAFLSGIFSILAFYGFIEAYLIQSKELRLQRFELKESIKAQQGSEQALKEQSEALKSQLKINEEQFNLYLLEAKSKVPIFIFSKIHYFNVQLLEQATDKKYKVNLLEGAPELKNLVMSTYFITEINFSIKVTNKGGGGKLIDVNLLEKPRDSCYFQEVIFQVIDSKNTEICDTYLIDFKLATMPEHSFLSITDDDFKAFVISIIENIKIETIFRNYERSYKQKYQICRTNTFDRTIQNPNYSIQYFEQFEIQQLLKHGYRIEVFE
ncbi:hypothetical protein [uncultured Psychrobacter sp.]|uniref:hypothetical protein n=1 Tax=uncultured Psychrobacter sp. TaxID=259303 RepID=UPI00261FA2F3|nr:hypothetical protein [uncultured Psychrobacter sp.]